MMIEAWFMLAFFGADITASGEVKRYERRYISEAACLGDIERVLEQAAPHNYERAAVCLRGFYVNGRS